MTIPMLPHLTGLELNVAVKVTQSVKYWTQYLMSHKLWLWKATYCNQRYLIYLLDDVHALTAAGSGGSTHTTKRGATGMLEIVRLYPGTNTASKARDNAKYPDKDVTSQTVVDDTLTNFEYNVYTVAPITPQVSAFYCDYV